MLVLLANETEDIQTKAKPVVDALVKVDELIKTPEVQAVVKGIQTFGESVTKFLNPPPPCYWNYGRERRVNFSYNNNKYWVDEGFIRCLSRRGEGRDEIIRRVSQRTGASERAVAYYLNYDFYNW